MPRPPQDPAKTTTRKDPVVLHAVGSAPGDELQGWIDDYLELAVTGVRSAAVAAKITLHLSRFREFLLSRYGHARLGACLRRDVLAWQRQLHDEQRLAPATVNNHLASLSAFTTWVEAHEPGAFAHGDPAKGIGELGLPPLEPRSLTEEQVRSLKNVCDRLPIFHRLRGRQHQGEDEPPRQRVQGRPWRDRALVFVLLSTGLRREELVNLDLDQVEPNTPDELRRARRARIRAVRGKGRSERAVFLSQDARLALADYLVYERPGDATESSAALFLSARSQAARRADGRLSVRAVNLILEQIGRWHDAEVKDEARRLSPLRPHDLRHTFAFQLARSTGADAYELERRLGHRSQRYLQRYTNPPEETAAGYVEDF